METNEFIGLKNCIPVLPPPFIYCAFHIFIVYVDFVYMYILHIYCVYTYCVYVYSIYLLCIPWFSCSSSGIKNYIWTLLPKLNPGLEMEKGTGTQCWSGFGAADAISNGKETIAQRK